MIDKPMTQEEIELESAFKKALEKSGRIHYTSMSKPYMRENTAGYDSPYTQHLFDGFKLGLESAKEAL